MIYKHKNSAFILAITSLMFIGIDYVHAQPPGMPNAGPPVVRVEAVGTVSRSQPKSYVRMVVSKETVNLMPRVSGYLNNVAFQEGETVKEGDLLFEIEDTSYKINVRMAESVIRQIESEIELAKKDYERSDNLVKSKAITEQEFDEILRTIALHEAKLDEAKAKLEQAETDLSYTKIYAPLTGRIGIKQYSKGNYITATSGMLASIVQFDPVMVKFSMSMSDLAKFSKSGKKLQKAEIEILGANNMPYTGKFKIDFLDNHVDRRTDSLTVYLVCENLDEELIPGSFVKVRVAEQFEKPLPAVNVTALLSDGTRHYVYVVTAESKVERKNIVIGSLVFDKQIVTSGLELGEQVIVGGLNKVKPGEVVTIVQNENNKK